MNNSNCNFCYEEKIFEKLYCRENIFEAEFSICKECLEKYKEGKDLKKGYFGGYDISVEEFLNLNNKIKEKFKGGIL